MSDNKDWSSLSMRERAAYIRKAVFRGLSDIDDIRKDYHLYGGGGDTLQEEEPIYKVLPALLLLAGLDVRVTSGYRSSGKAGNAGSRSWHPRHGAVDIVPQGNTTFEDIENVIYNNPRVKLYLLSHNFGLLDESGRSKESRELSKRTGSTGAHFHFGRDTSAVNSYRLRVNALLGGDNGKVVYFTNPDIPLESLEPLVSRESTQMLYRMTPLEVLLNVTIPKPINIDDDVELDIAAEQTLPEIEVIGQLKTPNPLEILSLIQEVLTAPPVIQSYKIPAIQDIIGNLADERNTLLQKDLEDRIIAEDRRRRLGYSYRDSGIEDDIKLMQFLRNMSAYGGKLFDTGGDSSRYNAEEDAYDAGVFPETYVTPFGNFNATLYPWLAALMTRMQQYDDVNPLLGDTEETIRLKSVVNGKLGRLNTAVISPEWIKKAAESARKGGYDPVLAVALMSRESTIGNPTDGPSTAKLWSGKTIQELLKLGIDPYEATQNIGVPFVLADRRKQVRLNNMDEYPYLLTGEEGDLSYRYNTIIGNHDHYNNQFPYYRMYGEAIGNVGLDRNAIDNWIRQHYSAEDFEAVPSDPIIDALDYYSTGNYNSGWKGLYPAVQREYREVTNNPQLMLIINGTKNTKSTGGLLNNIILDTNSYGGGGLTSVINVPSSLRGLWSKAKLRLYRTITPKGYHLLNATKEFISGNDRDFSKFTPAENEVWARYLGVPYEGESSFEKAVYAPTKGGATYDDVIKFKDESLILSDDVLRQLLQNQMTTGKNTLLIEGNESGLGTYTVSLGEDENGKYISYYDDWDINPTRGLSAKYKIPFLELIGDIVPGTHPFTVYGRRYYTDEDLRRVIEK